MSLQLRAPHREILLLLAIGSAGGCTGLKRGCVGGDVEGQPEVQAGGQDEGQVAGAAAAVTQAQNQSQTQSPEGGKIEEPVPPVPIQGNSTVIRGFGRMGTEFYILASNEVASWGMVRSKLYRLRNGANEATRVEWKGCPELLSFAVGGHQKVATCIRDKKWVILRDGGAGWVRERVVKPCAHLKTYASDRWVVVACGDQVHVRHPQGVWRTADLPANKFQSNWSAIETAGNVALLGTSRGEFGGEIVRLDLDSLKAEELETGEGVGPIHHLWVSRKGTAYALGGLFGWGIVLRISRGARSVEVMAADRVHEKYMNGAPITSGTEFRPIHFPPRAEDFESLREGIDHACFVDTKGERPILWESVHGFLRLGETSPQGRNSPLPEGEAGESAGYGDYASVEGCVDLGERLLVATFRDGIYYLDMKSGARTKVTLREQN